MVEGSEQPGAVIDKYKLIQQIGEGGFGVVYLAEQEQPVRRQVALKVIKLGMDTKEVIARFDAERQALAMMEHPNIAKVLDAGATKAGRPYFVMELVKGDPISDYCDRERVTTRKRLELFMLVCRAVQHAHQKGIIHRDIKPSNVLVTFEDGKPVPKVIDFGIAKATDQRLTEQTVFTQLGQFIGTPEYMSPEQAEMSAQDIDTRSDIYSLGVLLYELLTGTTPFDAVSLRRAGLAEIQRIIREEEPPRPSTRLSSLVAEPASSATPASFDAATVVADDVSPTDVVSGLSPESVAYQRRTDLRSLGRMLRGDLDWIIMKAMEKDRTRRYETANGLAADIARHLADEPVTAGPPSTSYRVQKFVRRNRGLVAAGLLVTTTLVIGLTGTTLGLGWALSEKARAEKAEGETAERAAELEQVAEFQASQLSEIDVELMAVRLREDLLLEVQAERPGSTEANGQDRADRLSELLAGTNLTNVALKTLDRNIFARALAAVDAQFANQPLVRARLLHTMAETFREVGLLDHAVAPQTEALEIRRRVLGDDHPDTLRSVGTMGQLLLAQGKHAEAEPFYIEALKGKRSVLGDDDPETLSSVNNMGYLLKAQGKFAEAESYYREAVGGWRRVLGNDDPETLNSVGNMGSLLQSQGKLSEAEPYYSEALEGRRRVLGDDHPHTLRSVGNMGSLLEAQGKFIEAEPYHREALEGYRRVLGDDHPHTLGALNNMAFLLQAQGKFAEAEPYYREALAGGRRVLGDDHPNTLGSISNMGFLFGAQGKLTEAEPYVREALEGYRRVLGDDHPATLRAVHNMGAMLRAQGRLAEAEPYVREALKGNRRMLGDDHPETLLTVSNLAALLQAQGQPAEAERHFREAVDGFRRVLGEDHPYTRDNTRYLCAVLNALGRYAESEEMLRDSLPTHERTLGAKHWKTAEASSLLGAAMVGLERHEDAEPLLLEAHAQLDAALPDTRRAAKMRESIERLVTLYDSWGKPDEAAAWRAKLKTIAP